MTKDKPYGWILPPNMTINLPIDQTQHTAVPGLKFSLNVLMRYTNSFSRLGVATHFVHSFYVTSLVLELRSKHVKLYTHIAT